MAGLKGRVEFLTERVYQVNSPGLVFVSGVYFVSMSVLPDELRTVFIDQSRGDTAALPSNRTWTGECFREIYNSWFATIDEFISADVSTDIQRRLPPLIQTIEVVGDDEPEMTYDDWIYAQTGRRLPKMGCERMFSRATRGGFKFTELLDASQGAVGHIGDIHHISCRKNRAAAEPGFVCLIAGCWEQPNSAASPSDTNEAGVQAYGASTSTFDTNLLRNSDTWISRQDDDAVNLGVISGTQASINLFEGGDVYFGTDWDPSTVAHSDSATADATVPEATEGAEDYSHWQKAWFGMSVMTDIGLF